MKIQKTFATLLILLGIGTIAFHIQEFPLWFDIATKKFPEVAKTEEYIPWVAFRIFMGSITLLSGAFLMAHLYAMQRIQNKQESDQIP